MPNGYFSVDELKKFQAVEGKKLLSVRAHYWHNLPADFAFLSWLELGFEQNETLTIATDEDLSGLAAPTFFLEVEEDQAAALGGQVLIQTEDWSESAVWRQSIGQPLQEIGLIKEAENWYRNTQVLFRFEGNQVLVEKSEEEEGVSVSPYTM